MRRDGRVLSLARRATLGVAATALLSGCSTIEAVTPQGRKIQSFYEITFALSVVIFVGVMGVLLYSLVAYRKKPGDDTLPPQTHGNTLFEVIWTAIPIVIVLALFAGSYATLREIDDEGEISELAAIINVRAVQWGWEFDYGDGKVVAGNSSADEVPEMVVPVNEPVRVVLNSTNVIHAFYVPHFLFKRDVVPGRNNQFEFTVEIPGTYKGQCAELCGRDHAKMNFTVKAVTRKAFDDYITNFKTDLCEGDKSTPASELELSSPAGEVVFDKKCLQAAAGKPVKLAYANGGGGQVHNVAIIKGLPNAPESFLLGKAVPEGIIPSGSITYDVPASPAGDYTFFCQVHPSMKGTYKVT